MTNKQIVRMFPDYSETCFWKGDQPGGGNMDEEDFVNILPEFALLALKYWQQTWRRYIERKEDYGGSCWWANQREGYLKMFNEDGNKLVQLMNNCQDVYHFVYVKTR